MKSLTKLSTILATLIVAVFSVLIYRGWAQSTATTIGANITTTGNLTVDTDTFFVNSADNRVGIGTTSPTAKLDIAGDIVIPNQVGYGLKTSDGSVVQVGFLDGSNNLIIGRSGSGSTNVNDLYFRPGGSTKVIFQSNGDVGIGKVPSYKLDVEGAINIPVNTPYRSNGNAIIGTTGSIDTFIRSYNNDIQFQDSAGSELARIKNNGNFGIGTTSPQSTFHVPDGKYAQFEDNNSGAPTSADCDADAERGRISIDTASNRVYICNGATRGWDFVTLTD